MSALVHYIAALTAAGFTIEIRSEYSPIERLKPTGQIDVSIGAPFFPFSAQALDASGAAEGVQELFEYCIEQLLATDPAKVDRVAYAKALKTLQADPRVLACKAQIEAVASH